MPASQLRLFPAPQPLVERLGAAFFRGAPQAPGVYRMYDGEGRLLYVGKARDLRARLASYRRTHGQSRKTIRLIHAARRVEWEVCPSETDARLRENDLIRTHRPRFNRVGTWPRSARFILLERPETGAGFSLRLAADPAGEAYGAFRGGAGFALAALARLLSLAWDGLADPLALPHRLLHGERLGMFEARHPDAPGWMDDVRSYLAAGGDGLVARLVATVPEPRDAFGRMFVAAQFECLASFYRRGPLLNRRLRTGLPAAPATLAAEQLDDLRVLVPVEEVAPAFRPLG